MGVVKLGACFTKAAITTWGTEQLPVMNTRMPDEIAVTAWSAVVIRFW